MSRAVVILGTLLSAAAAAAFAGQARAPLIVAYVVSDGELVPIAVDGVRGAVPSPPGPG